VGDDAGAVLIARVPVHELEDLRTDASRLGQVGEVGEGAALHEAAHLVVVVLQREVRRVRTDEPSLEVGGGVMDVGEVRLLAVEGIDQIAEVGDDLTFGLVEVHARPVRAAAGRESSGGEGAGGSGTEQGSTGWSGNRSGPG